ncbi:hypothetical protein [Mesonia mobilis]|uniref:hypothetical protein n=1 Tax=Mesonia mobilis TaxID=369791 RepID=UPI0026F01776|nr:hypothetical protein [Mesonia mobilis]
MTTSTQKIPTWFWIISIVLLLWNLMGIGSFVFHSFIMKGEALAALPENERALYGEYPLWTHIAFGIATIGALLANILLLAKKKIAITLFVISLIAILIQMFHNLFLTSAAEVYGNATYVMPILVIIIAIFEVWFSKFAYQKTWIK